MKKLLLLTMSALFIFTGCQKKEESKSVDVSTLADEIVQTKAFDDSLSKTENNVAYMLLNIDSEKINDISCYMNTGATPEMVVVLKANEDYKQTAIDSLKSYINSEKENFESYKPEEVVKIDNMILQEVSDTVVLCVSNKSDKVNEILNNYSK